MFRIHQRQLVDLRPGRGHVPPGRSANPDDLPRSRWVRALGGEDQVVAWFKPKRRPQWITPAEFEALPGELSWSCGVPMASALPVTKGARVALFVPHATPAAERAIEPDSREIVAAGGS